MTLFSMKIGESCDFIDIFCIIAIQNRVLTEFATGLVVWARCLLSSFIVLMSVIRIFLPLVIRYSTPLSVLAITLMRLRMACCIAGWLMLSKSIKKLSLTLLCNKKTSFLTSSYIKFFRSSGEIYKALTRSDNSTSTTPLTLPCYFA